MPRAVRTAPLLEQLPPEAVVGRSTETPGDIEEARCSCQSLTNYTRKLHFRADSRTPWRGFSATSVASGCI